jgi:hypothetical protein
MRLDEKYRRKLLGIFPNARICLHYGLTDVLKFEKISDASLPPGVKKKSGSAAARAIGFQWAIAFSRRLASHKRRPRAR